ncbi:NERD domain-containing protein [Bacillus sp. Marseille-Q3570]|uniref:NERD domain-containing protein n=1 Tax=Bacillus sp. Marseille-Q3570 TaxID=2963522 RepID=UPI0021B7615D|nr:NERD domain-containing protein [Bacillus sp. Marseille-Q3570]
MAVGSTENNYHFILSNCQHWLAGHSKNTLIYLRKLPQEKYFIFHHIRLPSGNSYFQMDIILLSRRLFLFLEVKNISGTLFFEDKFNQMTRINEDGKEERFPESSDSSIQSKRTASFMASEK